MTPELTTGILRVRKPKLSHARSQPQLRVDSSDIG